MTSKSVDLPTSGASSWQATRVRARRRSARSAHKSGAVGRVGKVDDGTSTSISSLRSRSAGSR